MISLTGIGGGVVAWFTYILEAPYPGRISGGTFEIGAAKFGHLVERVNANTDF